MKSMTQTIVLLELSYKKAAEWRAGADRERQNNFSRIPALKKKDQSYIHTIRISNWTTILLFTRYDEVKIVSN